MKIVSIGGGPAGLYFAILMKEADPSHEIVVYERNRADDTFGFGVVFSDATLGNLRKADPTTFQRIEERFAHWDDIDIHFGGEMYRSTGHGFCGFERHALLEILQGRCRELGVTLHFEHPVDSLEPFADADLILAADGVSSFIRDRYVDDFGADVDMRPNKFVWLGTTVPFEAFTFFFKENDAGMWRVHAYRYAAEHSTFIVECTDDTWRRANLVDATEEQTIEYLEAVFAEELAGHRLIKNRSIWRNFPTIKNRRWHRGNVVLVGDAVHTAHFSIGSGTKLAMEDGIDLRDSLLEHDDIETALVDYERRRRPEVERLQRAAQVSLEWFENTERYAHFTPAQFAFSLMTRSLRVGHDNLKLRDPELVLEVDRWFAKDSGVRVGDGSPPLPMHVPLEVAGQVCRGRLIAAPTEVPAGDGGAASDAHLVLAGSRAIGGAAVVMIGCAAVTESGRATDVSPGLYSETHVHPWALIVSFVHHNSDAIAGLRLCCSGTVPTAADGDAIVAGFVRAAEFAHAAGLRWLEIDAAGGGMLAACLSPLTNTGDLEHRLSVPLAVVGAVREVWPTDSALVVRYCAHDWVDGGISGADSVVVGQRLVAAGANAVAVTTGYTVAGSVPPDERLAQTPYVDRVRNEGRLVAIADGGIASSDDVNSILAAGRADMCSLHRAHLHDPAMSRRAAERAEQPLDWPPLLVAAAGDFKPREP